MTHNDYEDNYERHLNANDLKDAYMYFNGFVIAFLLGIFKTIIVCQSHISQKAKNMSQIGYYYNTFSNSYTTNKQKIIYKILHICYLLIIDSFLSWVSVFFSITTIIIGMVKSSRISTEIKNINKQISTLPLSKIQMLAFFNDIQKHYGYTCELNIGDNYSLFLNTKDNIFTEKYNSPDFLLDMTVESEYRIENFTIYSRVINKKSNDYGKINYLIKDSVVLEDEVIKQYSNKELAESEIQKLNDEIKWVQVVNIKIILFIISNHYNDLNILDLRNYFRNKIIKMQKFKNTFSSSSGLANEIEETESGFYINWWDNTENIEEINIQKYGLNTWECSNLKIAIKEIEDWFNSI